ncbi:MAG: hypothetical protein K2K87_05180 [Lachnospiraceae bacterium]|nr:hypothetical protein [Lachnospiraceae bacterium]
MANALIKRMVLSCDSDFTKLAPAERQRLEFAEQEIEAGETISHDEIDWNAVEEYLQKYVGGVVTIAETEDVVYIGSAFSDEYKGSKYTKRLKGANAKAKANASQGIMEMLEIATEKRFREYHKEKHTQSAENGKLYLYDLVDIKREASTPLTISQLAPW